jgi:hypothetical protein
VCPQAALIGGHLEGVSARGLRSAGAKAAQIKGDPVITSTDEDEAEEDEAKDDDDDDDDSDGDFEFDLSGVDPSLLGMLGGPSDSKSSKPYVATTWTPPAAAGLENSLDGVELAKARGGDGSLSALVIARKAD